MVRTWTDRTFSTALLRLNKHVSARRNLNIKCHTLITLLKYHINIYFHFFLHTYDTVFFSALFPSMYTSRYRITWNNTMFLVRFF